MTVNELMEKLRALPGHLDVMTDDIGFTRLHQLGDPVIEYGVHEAGGTYVAGRQDEARAVAYVYFPAPGI